MHMMNNKFPCYRIEYSDYPHPEDVVINCVRPTCYLQRSQLASHALKRLPYLFSLLPLRRKPEEVVGKTHADYGSHQLILNLVNSEDMSQEKVGEFVFGHYENRHSTMRKKSLFGLTKTTVENQVFQEFAKEVIQSLCDVDLPHRFGYARLNTIRGARTTAHTDNMRGPTVNLVNFHSESDGPVDARIMVKCWPEFRTSVVQLSGNLYIPFEYTEAENSLVMIGAGFGSVSHNPEDMVRSCKRKFNKVGSATFFEFPSSALDDLQPFGSLNNVVVGIKNGYLQSVPFLNAFDPSGESFGSPSQSMNVLWCDAVKYASVNRHLTTKKQEKPVQVGNIPNKWHMFYGWRFIHWFEGDPMVSRTHVFFRFMREHNTGGSLVRAEDKRRCNFVAKL